MQPQHPTAGRGGPRRSTMARGSLRSPVPVLPYGGLSKKEYRRMQLSTMRAFGRAFVQQDLARSKLPIVLFEGYSSVLLIFLLGVALLILGVLCFTLNDMRESEKVFYSETDLSVNISIPSGFKTPTYLYTVFEDYYGNFRQTITSRPGELPGDYSCGDFSTAGSLSAIRIPTSLPELWNLNPNSTAEVFPCGISSFALFNDVYNVILPPIGGVTFTTNVISETEKLIGFTIRPPEGDLAWMPPWNESFRSWMSIPTTSTFLRLVGRFEGSDPNNGEVDLPEGPLQIDITQNDWPNTPWSARKGLVLVVMSSWGSRQVVLEFCCWVGGGLLVAISLLLALFRLFHLKYVRKSVKWIGTDHLEDRFLTSSPPGSPPNEFALQIRESQIPLGAIPEEEPFALTENAGITSLAPRCSVCHHSEEECQCSVGKTNGMAQEDSTPSPTWRTVASPQHMLEPAASRTLSEREIEKEMGIEDESVQDVELPEEENYSMDNEEEDNYSLDEEEVDFDLFGPQTDASPANEIRPEDVDLYPQSPMSEAPCALVSCRLHDPYPEGDTDSDHYISNSPW